MASFAEPKRNNHITHISSSACFSPFDLFVNSVVEAALLGWCDAEPTASEVHSHFPGSSNEMPSSGETHGPNVFGPDSVARASTTPTSVTRHEKTGQEARRPCQDNLRLLCWNVGGMLRWVGSPAMAKEVSLVRRSERVGRFHSCGMETLPTAKFWSEPGEARRSAIFGNLEKDDGARKTYRLINVISTMRASSALSRSMVSVHHCRWLETFRQNRIGDPAGFSLTGLKVHDGQFGRKSRVWKSEYLATVTIFF